MKALKKMILVIGCAAVSMLTALPVLAAEAFSVPESAPVWVGTVALAIAAIQGMASQIDAHIPEEFKRRWPWWLVMGWNYLAGNYKHSKNAGM